MKTLFVALLLITSIAAAQPKEKPKLLVTSITVGGGVEAETGKAMTDSLAAEVSRRGFFNVLSSNDVQQLIGLERQKQLMGCGEDSSSCLAELANAMGVDFVMSGTITRLGDAYQLTLQTLNTQKAQPLGRSTRIASDLKALNGFVPYAVAEATATPAPAPPSRILPFTALGIGTAALVAGGGFGFLAFAQEQSVNAELARGESNPAALGTLESYQAQTGEIARNKNVSLALLGVGALAVGTGIFLLRSESNVSGAQASLLVTGNGFAVVGDF